MNHLFNFNSYKEFFDNLGNTIKFYGVCHLRENVIHDQFYKELNYICNFNVNKEFLVNIIKFRGGCHFRENVIALYTVFNTDNAFHNKPNDINHNYSEYISGNREIDDFFKQAGDALKWYIDYKMSKRIIEIDRGGFATIFVAEWENDTYESKIVLKEIHNSENNSTKLLNEANALYKCMKKGDALINFMKCYGMSQNPLTKNYVIVMQYFERGSLKRNLIDVIGKKWHKKLKMLSQIAMNLKTIQEVNLIHKDLHSGNILLDEHFNSYISDMGLSEPSNAKSNADGIYGVLPYVAPEVLSGNPYTAASDIYSFGIIMWEITSGRFAFANNAHDSCLLLKIINGLRPTVLMTAPQCYINLMMKCWDNNPENRPSAIFIYNTLEQWLNKYETQQQFMKFDETIKSAITHSSLNIHSEEIYINSFMPNFYTTRPDNVRQEYELFEYNSFEQEYELFEYDSSENSRAIDLGMSSFVSAYLKK